MTDEQDPQELFQDSSKPQWTIWIAAGGCAVFLFGAIFVGVLIFAGPEFVQQFIPNHITAAGGLPREITAFNTMGDPNAPVHIIEYVDFQCPYCLKLWSETEPQLIEEYVNTGMVYFEYRSFPILGTESVWAAEGAYCAGDQNKFWEYHDTLFTNWTGENVGDYSKEKLISYADALNLDMTEFESCLSEERHKGKVEEDKAQGDANGVNATPTFFINGLKIEGSQPFDVLKEYIEQALDGNLKLNTESG